MRYRKRPIEVDAIQWTEGNEVEVEKFLGDSFESWWPSQQLVELRTLEGALTAPLGYWFIRGVAGEHYPCAPEIFEQTYEKV